MSTTLTFTDPDADAAAIAAMSRDELTETGPELLRQSRKYEARTVLAAAALAERVFGEHLAGRPETGVWGSVIEHAERLGRAEVSLQFKVSRSKAGSWVALADLLEKFPLIRTAYLNGELSTNRASIMARAAQRGQNIDTTDSDSDSNGGDESGDNAEMTFEEIVLDYGSRATTDPVLSQQLDAALISMNPDSVIEDRDTITDLVGHVTITPDVAGHSALGAVVPAHYGVFLTAQINALVGERTCRKDPRRVGSLRVIALGEIIGVPGAHLDCACGQDDCPKRGGGTDSNGSAETPADPDYATTLADVVKPIHYPESARAAGPLIPQISDRPQAPPADPTGHGGFTVPPPGALTYAPSAALRAEVLANDAWCRYPYCGMPSHLCDLDHWRPFNHTDPEVGGWTVLGDLIPLCRADHQRKHLAEWVPTLFLDRRVEWRSRWTGQVIVTYPR
ncbi:DUF222 domain-containing protein [Gordonia sp. L191]|uniref:HNH endonuclease signature motif containing protein n=1 Tax=Gordonia sp. L191 TaxID=2982699 RepID=UPI0024C018DA|nr:HNH endonuclease signature motif containing protein [Gordonia sp. L191]WHU48082.1 DUF222 domain-containing protein [Gordonia sp. L191]